MSHAGLLLFVSGRIYNLEVDVGFHECIKRFG
jgi:hypothetical protein